MPETTLPLKLLKGHLFLAIAGELWLLDTGSPSSFGRNDQIELSGTSFPLHANYLGLTVEQLSAYIEHPCAGLLGADVLSEFDFLLDVPQGLAVVSSDHLSHQGEPMELSFLMGVPIVQVRIGGINHRMLFDTGAKVSYFQDEGLDAFPRIGVIPDFYPGLGAFETTIHEVDVSLGQWQRSLHFGSLPSQLATGLTRMLTLAGTSGILGNQFLEDLRVGYFPRRRMLVL